MKFYLLAIIVTLNFAVFAETDEVFMIASKEDMRFDGDSYDKRSVANIGHCFGTCFYNQNCLSMNVFTDVDDHYLCYFFKNRYKGGLENLSFTKHYRYYEKNCIFLQNSNEKYYDCRSNGVRDSCLSWLHSGRTENGLYRIIVNGNELEVFCDMETDGGGWIRLQHRFDGSVDFDRTWSDFRNGFGDLSSEVWLGNEHVHQLTNFHNYELRIEATNFKGDSQFMKLSKFFLKHEADGYQIQFQSCTEGHCGYIDGLVGSRFYTPDKDDHGKQCATRHQNSFWYSTNLHCLYFALNGKYQPTNLQSHSGLFWGWNGEVSLKNSTMMFRKVP